MRLLNVIEQQSTMVRDLQIKNQELRDEINQLKGEQGKPKIRGNKNGPKPVQNHSSEKNGRGKPSNGERRARKQRSR